MYICMKVFKRFFLPTFDFHKTHVPGGEVERWRGGEVETLQGNARREGVQWSPLGDMSVLTDPTLHYAIQERGDNGREGDQCALCTVQLTDCTGWREVM